MDTTRQHKVSRLLQKELSEFFLRERNSLFNKVWITVTEVRVSADLSVAKMYLSFFPVSDKKAMLETVKLKSKEIRKRISEQVKKQIRIIPEFIFFIDDSLDQAERIEELLKKK